MLFHDGVLSRVLGDFIWTRSLFGFRSLGRPSTPSLVMVISGMPLTFLGLGHWNQSSSSARILRLMALDLEKTDSNCWLSTVAC